ncbi:ABC transporter ATP-binding protein [Paraclostridium bifermentans]|uniref:ABC transporter ATP-binding protein n=1 Tax=Paraclostridium bifermentans TaxID=1490 RepID=UPI003D29EDF4
MSILRLKDIRYISDNTQILDSVNLNIEKGDCVSIIGASGSGKSTLLKICSDLISPTNGEIFFEEKNYLDYDPIELRQKISYCVQIPYLFGKSVFDNLSYPFIIRKKEIDEQRILQFMKKLNLDSDYLHKDINALSGGEKQRVALIRNLMFTPDILLLDEVTSALDKENAKIVESLIKEMNDNGITVIWVTHSLEQSESIFNKRIQIDQGQICTEEDLR